MDEPISIRRALAPATKGNNQIPNHETIKSGYSPSCSPSEADLKRFTSTSSSSPFKENTTSSQRYSSTLLRRAQGSSSRTSSPRNLNNESSPLGAGLLERKALRSAKARQHQLDAPPGSDVSSPIGAGLHRRKLELSALRKLARKSPFDVGDDDLCNSNECCRQALHTQQQVAQSLVDDIVASVVLDLCDQSPIRPVQVVQIVQAPTPETRNLPILGVDDQTKRTTVLEDRQMQPLAGDPGSPIVPFASAAIGGGRDLAADCEENMVLSPLLYQRPLLYNRFIYSPSMGITEQGVSSHAPLCLRSVVKALCVCEWLNGKMAMPCNALPVSQRRDRQANLQCLACLAKAFAVQVGTRRAYSCNLELLA